MDSFLTAVKSAHKEQGKIASQPPLTPLRSLDISPLTQKANGTSIGNESSKIDPRPRSLSDPTELLQFLRSEPDTEQLLDVLERLYERTLFSDKGFTISSPGPAQAQIINTLVCSVIPTYWWVLKDSTRRQGLISCLYNIAGFNAVLAQLKKLSSSRAASKDGVSSQAIRELLEVSSELFRGDGVLSRIWQEQQRNASTDTRKQLIWREFVNLIGSGKVVATIAQAEDATRDSEEAGHTSTWLSDGTLYSKWLGTNIANMVLGENDSTNAAALILAKSLGLGYSTSLLAALFATSLKTRNEAPLANIRRLIGQLPTYARAQLLAQTLRWYSSRATSRTEHAAGEPAARPKSISGFAALLAAFNIDDTFPRQLEPHMSDPVLCGTISSEARRSCVALLSSLPDFDLDSLLERIVRTFGDHLFITHRPIMQQQALAQTLLLVAGCVHRRAPISLLMIARSSHHMQGVSNRLDTSNQRARWLGMVVGTAMSNLVDKDGTKMKFGTDDMETEEAQWYLDLVAVEDQVGSVEDVRWLLHAENLAIQSHSSSGVETRRKTASLPLLDGKPVFGPIRPPIQTEIIGDRISEVLDGPGLDVDDGLKPYAKPDSDAEDSEEDATLVNRTKIRAPVYIRDLMGMLRDDKDPERFNMGIKHAAALIRRKTNFGSEVRDHAEELGSILSNLQDPFSTDNFDELKLQALIAVLLSDAATMAPWLSRQVFVGEYSIAQRGIMLSTLGLGGRELAGLKDEDDLNPSAGQPTFPSKRLPPRLEAIYGRGGTVSSTTQRLEAAATSTQQHLIEPMALTAADKRTSHLDAVKVRAFSSRLDPTASAARTRRRPAANRLAQIFAPAFFYPLTGHYQQDASSETGDGGRYEGAAGAVVLVTLLKTLALLLHAAGPATLELPQVTSDFWDLLLALRVRAGQDVAVLQAVLFALLTLLEVNAGGGGAGGGGGDGAARITRENPRQLMLTQQWVELVFEGTGRDGEEETKIRALAAAVLVKTGEIISAYQRELVGFDF